MSYATDVVRDSYTAYHQQDIDTANRLLSDEHTFTSPQDDHIDKHAYFERCFPTADRFTRAELREITEPEPGLVFIRYVYELVGGAIFSNIEAITVRESQILTIQVYFGGPTTWSQ